MIYKVCFLVLLQVAGTFAITDMNCTTNGAYAANAVACDDISEAPFCTTVYPAVGTPPAAIAAGGTGERPQNCYTNAASGPTMTALVDAALLTCPKTCGYCCKRPEYNCRDALVPNIDCNIVNKRMCEDSQWRQIIADNCPSKCGFCLDGGCIDVAVECAAQPGICLNINMQAFVQTNCRRTCSLCTTSTTSTTSTTVPGVTTTTTAASAITTTRTPSATCVDSHRNCANMVRNRFCTNLFYNAAVRRQHCARSCGLC